MPPCRSKTGPVGSQGSSCSHQPTAKLHLPFSSCSTEFPDNHYRAKCEPIFPEAQVSKWPVFRTFRAKRESDRWMWTDTLCKKTIPFQLTILCFFFLKPKTILFKNFPLTKNLVGKTCLPTQTSVCTHRGRKQACSHPEDGLIHASCDCSPAAAVGRPVLQKAQFPKNEFPITP